MNGGPHIPFGLFVSLSECLLLPFHTRADTIYDLLFAIRRQGCCNTHHTLPPTTHRTTTHTPIILTSSPLRFRRHLQHAPLVVTTSIVPLAIIQTPRRFFQPLVPCSVLAWIQVWHGHGHGLRLDGQSSAVRSTTSSRVPESPLNGLNRPSRQAVRSLRSWILQPRGTDHAKKESRTVAGNSATNPEPSLSWFHLGSILAPACLLAS